MKRGLAGLARLVLLAALTDCGGSNPPSAPANNNPPTVVPPATIPADVSPAVRSMLQSVPQQIASALAENRASLPNNPNNASYITAKIAMLERPTLTGEIYNGRFFVEGFATANGRNVPVIAVFAQEQMRSDTTEAVRSIERSLAVLEEFMRTPFPTPEIRLWYGFKIGNTGGGGSIYSEDRTTYEARTSASRLPFDAILYHEVSHSYIGSEGLTQFLEVYVYNVLQTGSPQPSSWTFLRGWTPMLDSNRDVAAVLDVYQLLGKDAMSSAYAAVYPLRPPYGSPLSASAIQVFVDHAPAAAKTQVSQKLGQVTF